MPADTCPVCLRRPMLTAPRHRHHRAARWTDARVAADAAALTLDPTGQNARGRHRA